MWLHGLGDSGLANEPIKTLFRSSEFKNTKWAFPSAHNKPVTCNYGASMPSWFDILEIPVTAASRSDQNVHKVFASQLQTCDEEPSCLLYTYPTTTNMSIPQKDENSVLKAVQNVHTMINKEIATGTDPKNVFLCGFSQGSALTLPSVLLYRKTLGGGAVFSGWVPINSSTMEQFPPDAKKTPLLWSLGMADQTVLFETGQAGLPFLEKAGVTCEFKACPGLGHSINNEELRYLELWIKTRLQRSS